MVVNFSALSAGKAMRTDQGRMLEGEFKIQVRQLRRQQLQVC